MSDALMIHSMDRLARNLPDLLKLVTDLTGRGVTVKFQKEALTFTGKKNLMQDLQLAVIGAVAQFELAMLRERQREGVAAAKRAGKHCGRKSKLTVEQVKEIIASVEVCEDKTNFSKAYGISRATVCNCIKRKNRND